MKQWFVYGLYDPRTDLPFYVGMTGNVPQTMARHWDSRSSAARERCAELKVLGLQLDLRILSRHESRADALAEESRLILATPALVNRTHKAPKPREPIFNFELSVADRALLEAHRQKLGARSAADAIRYLIRGWTGPADETEGTPPRLPVSGRSATQVVSARGRTAAKSITVAGKSAGGKGGAFAGKSSGQTVQVGPTVAAPGERLKKR